MSTDKKIQDFFVPKNTERKLEKLKITAYEGEEQDDAKLIGTFEAFYNPSTLSVKYGLKYDNQDGTATASTTPTPKPSKGYAPTTFTFDLLIDGTGASVPTGYYNNGLKMQPPPPPTQAVEAESSQSSPLSGGGQESQDEVQDTRISVAKIIENFLYLTYLPKRSTHRPGYLSLSWGDTLNAKCVLNDATVAYELFSPSGDPLRAKIQCSFTEYEYKEAADAKSTVESPDLTHSRTVQQGDTLPLMCERIYGDSKLYLQVARFNKLANYRRLVPGQKIYFPPLVGEKS